MTIVTGDRYLEKLVKFVEEQADPLIEGFLSLKFNPAGLLYIQSRLEALHELESFLSGAPVDYLRAYVSDLGDHRALEQLRRILRLLTSLKVVSILPSAARDPTSLSFLPFGRLKVLQLRGCDLSTSAAKGLLELRYTLERIICHNSTDALRHVFASRIMEIKDCPKWKQLSFVSCACNGLVLMDESLQLLPAVETLDLSRNKFARVDNLNKCASLKHLDLGFNHLRTTAPFSKVSCHIVKLVLRNNALTTLRGIENLRSLEGLDVSYNIISNLLELEFLPGLAYLQSLWLEGNPLCCARWYRAQVFSFFTSPKILKLDDKGISTEDFWKRQIIITSKRKQPASFGFYLPANDVAVGKGKVNKMRKDSRLAYIQSGDETVSICSDQNSVSCGNESQWRDDPHLSDDETEILGLMNRVENMNKERSTVGLKEFKDGMDISCTKFLECIKEGRPALHTRNENYTENVLLQGQRGEVSRYATDSFQVSGYESSPKTSSVFPISPPHYQEDLLHRWQYLAEEIFHLSVDSFSITSSDSSTSCSEVDLRDFEPSVLETDNFSNENYVEGSFNGHGSVDLLEVKFCNQSHGISRAGKNVINLFDSSGDQTEQCSCDFVASADIGKSTSLTNQEANKLENRKCRKKAKRRVVSILEEF